MLINPFYEIHFWTSIVFLFDNTDQLRIKKEICSAFLYTCHQKENLKQWCIIVLIIGFSIATVNFFAGYHCAVTFFTTLLYFAERFCFSDFWRDFGLEFFFSVGYICSSPVLLKVVFNIIWSDLESKVSAPAVWQSVGVFFLNLELNGTKNSEKIVHFGISLFSQNCWLFQPFQRFI